MAKNKTYTAAEGSKKESKAHATRRQYISEYNRARRYAMKTGQEFTLPQVRRPTGASIARVEEYHAGQVAEAARKRRRGPAAEEFEQSREEKRRKRSEAAKKGWETRRRKYGPTGVSETPEEPGGTLPEEQEWTPVETPTEPTGGGADDFGDDDEEYLQELAQQCFDRLGEIIQTIYSEAPGLMDLPIENAAESLKDEIGEMIKEGNYDAIAVNKDEIIHLFEQAVSYSHEAKRGADYYINFLLQIRGLINGSIYEEIGGFFE